MNILNESHSILRVCKKDKEGGGKSSDAVFFKTAWMVLTKQTRDVCRVSPSGLGTDGKFVKTCWKCFVDIPADTGGRSCMSPQIFGSGENQRFCSALFGIR